MPADRPSPRSWAIAARRRVVIEAVTPQIDGARFPAKRCIGEDVVVEADVFADGHDRVAAVLLHRAENEEKWIETPMRLIVNDRWRASFTVTSLTPYRFTVRAWIDRFATWQSDLVKRLDAAQDVSVELLVGAELLTEGARRAGGEDRTLLRKAAALFRAGGPEAVAAAAGPGIAEALARNPDRRHATTFEREL